MEVASTGMATSFLTLPWSHSAHRLVQHLP
jgi:hypothetical protein